MLKTFELAVQVLREENLVDIAGQGRSVLPDDDPDQMRAAAQQFLWQLYRKVMPAGPAPTAASSKRERSARNSPSTPPS